MTVRRLGRRLLPPRMRRALRSARTAPPAAPAPAPAAAPAPADGPPPHREALVRMLERGEPLDRAMIAQVRSLVGAKQHDTAVAIAESLRARPETAALGHLAAGIAAARRGYRELAWQELRGLPRVTWATYAPAEYVRSGLTVAPEEALREIRALVAEDPAEVRAKSWHEILAAVWGLGEAELARDVFAIFERHVRRGLAALAQRRAAPRLDAAMGRRGARLAAGARAARRAADVRGDGLRPPVRDEGVRQHRRPRPDDRGARPPRPPPGRPPARPRGAGRPARAAAAPDAARAPARRRRGGPRDHHRAPRRLDLRADPGRHVDALLRLVHALAVQDAPRLPAAPQPAADLRLVPLQQARAAHAGRDRVPQALRAGRLPRLDDGRPAALDRRAGVLLRLPHHDDRHGLPGPDRAARPARAPVAYVDMPADEVPAGAPQLTSTAAARSGGARSSRTSTRRSTCSRPTGASTAGSSRRGCTATCRCARSAWTSTSSRGTARTSGSTG